MTRDGQSASQSVPNVDLRGFSYALTPYLRKQEWQMERLQARMTGLQHSLAQAEHALQEQEASMQAHAAQMRQAMHSRPDPLLHRRGLAFLSGLHARIDSQKQEVQALRAQKADLQAECLAQQRSIDGLLEHRTQALHEYALEAGRAAAAEADRDWVGRLAMRQSLREFRGEQSE